MALIQEIKDGVALGDKAHKTGGTTTGKGAAKKNSDTKDMFLKLLVAEMKYQDPMEPTSNTEYVKEMSTLSQVESLENMEKTITNSGYQNYVGKYVEVTDENGKVVDGIVEYVTDVEGEKMLSIDGNQYKADSVTSVYDSKYAENNYTLQTFESLYAKLPHLERVTAADEADIVKVVDLYNSMSDDLRSSISDIKRDNLTALYNRVEQIVEATRKAAEEKAAETGAVEDTEASGAAAEGAAEEGADASDIEADDITKETVAENEIEKSEEAAGEETEDPSEENSDKIPTNG